MSCVSFNTCCPLLVVGTGQHRFGVTQPPLHYFGWQGPLAAPRRQPHDVGKPLSTAQAPIASLAGQPDHIPLSSTPPVPASTDVVSASAAAPPISAFPLSDAAATTTAAPAADSAGQGMSPATPAVLPAAPPVDRNLPPYTLDLSSTPPAPPPPPPRLPPPAAGTVVAEAVSPIATATTTSEATREGDDFANGTSSSSSLSTSEDGSAADKPRRVRTRRRSPLRGSAHIAGPACVRLTIWAVGRRCAASPAAVETSPPSAQAAPSTSPSAPTPPAPTVEATSAASDPAAQSVAPACGPPVATASEGGPRGNGVAREEGKADVEEGEIA